MKICKNILFFLSICYVYIVLILHSSRQVVRVSSGVPDVFDVDHVFYVVVAVNQFESFVDVS